MRKTIIVKEDSIKEKKTVCKIFRDIEVELYNCNVVIFKGEEAKKYLKASDVKEMNCAINRLKENGDVVICLENKSYKSTIAHELCHATQMIMHFIGHDFNKEYDEPFAYLLGFLTKEYYK